MSHNMKTITFNKRSRAETLHIEAPGCIVNIRLGSVDGKPCTFVSVSADGSRYAGEDRWFVDGDAKNTGLMIRVVNIGTEEDEKRRAKLAEDRAYLDYAADLANGAI